MCFFLLAREAAPGASASNVLWSMVARGVGRLSTFDIIDLIFVYNLADTQRVDRKMSCYNCKTTIGNMYIHDFVISKVL